jgi:hypothetical protein
MLLTGPPVHPRTYTDACACNKSVSNRTANLPSLNPANEDLNAGTWKTILLTRPDTFAVAAPAATTSPSYAADLNEIKGYQKNLTSDQLRIDQILERRRRFTLE